MKKKWIYRIAVILVALLLIALLTGNEAAAAKLPAMLVSIAAGMVLILAIIMAAYFFSSRHRKKEDAFKAAAEAVQGKVTKIDRVRALKTQESVYSVGGEMYILRAAYEYEGKRYTGAKRSYFGQPPYKVGDPITVFIDPKNPSVSKILNDDHPVQEKL